MAEKCEARTPVAGERASRASEIDVRTLPIEAAKTKRTPRHDVRARIMVELARNLDLLGWAQEPFSELAGLSDRYFPKALHAHEVCGREPTWPVLQAMFDALFPDGYQLVVLPVPGPKRKEVIARYNALFPRKLKKQQQPDGAAE